MAIVPSSLSAYQWSTHALMSSQAYSRSQFGLTDSQDHIARRLGFVSGKDQDLLNDYIDIGPTAEQLRVRFSTDFESDIFTSLSASAGVEIGTTKLDGWFARGAIREDDVEFDPRNLSENTPQDEPGGNFQRVFGHFYDPRNDRPLTRVTSFGPTAVSWAIDPNRLSLRYLPARRPWER